jgi:hypothetical protein
MGARNRTTEEQYDYLDGNLALYLNRLARNSKARIKLTRKDLRDTWDRQMGRCALTGIPMTFRAVAGECFPFNASIDCVLPRANGGTYEPANIRLVCSFVNASKYPPAKPGALVLEPLKAAYPCRTSQASLPLCGMLRLMHR